MRVLVRPVSTPPRPLLPQPSPTPPDPPSTSPQNGITVVGFVGKCYKDVAHLDSSLSLRLPFVFGLELEGGILHSLKPSEDQPELTAWITRGTTLQIDTLFFYLDRDRDIQIDLASRFF
ncbi:uncharacterized protein LOC142519625 [Primulina tabacum]|uniref:uncharacterized protein LOC142519625 n=1 Tax=Primulina tabacum TaxID=48773 RepID=UPI003F597A8C